MTTVSRNVDVLEETISKAERAVDPSKLRKVLFSLVSEFGCKSIRIFVWEGTWPFRES